MEIEIDERSKKSILLDLVTINHNRAYPFCPNNGGNTGKGYSLKNFTLQLQGPFTVSA